MACGDCLNPRGKNVLKTCVHNKMASVFSLQGLIFLLNNFFRSQSTVFAESNLILNRFNELNQKLNHF